MRKKLLFLIFLVIAGITVEAQIKATTNDGQAVILNGDGSWLYPEEDSAVLTSSNMEEEISCADVISTTEDKVTGETTTASKETLVISDDDGSTGFGMLFLLTSDESTIVWNIQAVGASSCIEDDSKMNILFRDGTRAELTQDGGFNCEADFTLYLGSVFGREEELKNLSTKQIEIMRVWTSDGFVEKDITELHSKKIKQSFSCLAALRRNQ